MVDTIEQQADTVPPVSPKQNVYLWSSWHPFNAYISSFDHDLAMLELLETASWKELSKACSNKNATFKDKTLLAMRKIMDLPVHYEEYWKDAPWIDPTQEWVGEQIRTFVAWYIATIGEPK